ncbi:MAG: hypothetical protein AAF934_10910 [Bacteroidota bacterium]
MEPSITKELDKLLEKVRTVLTKRTKVKPALDKLLPDLFDFRINAIKWFGKKSNLNFPEANTKTYSDLEEFKGSLKLGILIENTLFCLRYHKRVVEALIQSGEFPGEELKTTPTELTTVTYKQFLSTLALSVPNNEIAQKLVDWINNSLYIEFVILSTLLITEEKLRVADSVIDELAFIAADAAQEYAANAMEMGILKRNSKNTPDSISRIDKTFIEEQRYLSEMGMSDFAENF